MRSDAGAWPKYGEREKTRDEHLHQLRAYLGLSVFGLPDYPKLVHSLADLAVQADKAMAPDFFRFPYSPLTAVLR